MKNSRLALVVMGLAAAIAAPALAHHSAAMFDSAKEMTIQGTVTEFQYTNPHSWLHIQVPGAGGEPAKVWALEAEGPSTLFRAGIKAKTFKAGDKVTAVFHPMRDGRPAGGLMRVITADGTTFTPRPSGPSA